MGLSAKITGLRFMQRAMDKADVEKKAEETGSEAGTGAGNSEGDRGTADWVAKASPRSCVVLRGAGGGGATGRGRGRGRGGWSQAKGRLKFGGKVEVGGVELNEQERVVAEQVLEGEGAAADSKRERRKGDDSSSSHPKKKKRKNKV